MCKEVYHMHLAMFVSYDTKPAYSSYRRAPFLRAVIFMDFVEFWDFHKICFTKNYQKFYCNTDCRLKRRLPFS